MLSDLKFRQSKVLPVSQLPYHTLFWHKATREEIRRMFGIHQSQASMAVRSLHTPFTVVYHIQGPMIFLCLNSFLMKLLLVLGIVYATLFAIC